MSYFNYSRRKSSEVEIGDTPLGGDNPIRIQSMANVSTMDTEAAIEQCIRIIKAGAAYVRFTAQGVREAENLALIKEGIRKRGYNTPLVADIHFNPKAAEVAAQYVEKVRVNPGNFVDKVKTFAQLEYTDEEYAAELNKIRERFIPLIDICKAHHTALRIGVNHGSLSDRIMSRYGDTPEGMVESCLEFLRVCVEQDFHNVAISIKASNTVVMVKTVRLLVQRMDQEGMHFPLHLGVTEAGDGEDGRIKSAVGIGTLLCEGVGDTIRVSLSEDPEAEVPVAKKLVDYIEQRKDHQSIECELAEEFLVSDYVRRQSSEVQNIGGHHLPIVISDRSHGNFEFTYDLMPDYIYIGSEDPDNLPDTFQLLVDAHAWKPGKANAYPVFIPSDIEILPQYDSAIKFVRMQLSDLTDARIEQLKTSANVVVLLGSLHQNPVGEIRAFMHRLMRANCKVPVVICRTYRDEYLEDLQIKAAADMGALLLDGFADGIMISNEACEQKAVDSAMFGILQATRLRVSKTEYISCPSCGRTLFDLQHTIAKVKEATSHLKGLKIGIMGCIVNGPGEMADADYGYVGAGRGKVSLYKGKSCIAMNIPEDEAVDRLVALIKENGDWHDA